jgi:hypothetical protein
VSVKCVYFFLRSAAAAARPEEAEVTKAIGGLQAAAQKYTHVSVCEGGCLQALQLWGASTEASTRKTVVEVSCSWLVLAAAPADKAAVQLQALVAGGVSIVLDGVRAVACMVLGLPTDVLWLLLLLRVCC